jgi:hypothetical protein
MVISQFILIQSKYLTIPAKAGIQSPFLPLWTPFPTKYGTGFQRSGYLPYFVTFEDNPGLSFPIKMET